MCDPHHRGASPRSFRDPEVEHSLVLVGLGSHQKQRSRRPGVIRGTEIDRRIVALINSSGPIREQRNDGVECVGSIALTTRNQR